MDERIIRTKLDLIHRRATLRTWPIDTWQARTADLLAPNDYRYDDDWASISGETLWPALKTLFLRAQAESPLTAPGTRLYLYFDAEHMEGLLSLDGKPYAGIDAQHPRVVVPAGQPLALAAEFICVAHARYRPEAMSDKARLRSIAFAQVDEETEALYYDLWFCWDASRKAKDERRRQRLGAALEQALLAVDVTAPAESFCQDVATARQILCKRVAAIAPDPEGGRVFLTGHSHIDTAWLWPLRETVRKCGRTFATAARLLERFPDYHFTCSQPQLYAYTKQYFPAVYEEIKRWVKAGRWECTSGQWVESDCNVPSGEALVRQFLHGLRLFREDFGIRPRTCWLPDVFGYPASMPQILQGCGIENFYTNKLHWQARNPFPTHLFWWEGIDGTRVLAHIPRLRDYYNGWPNPEQLHVAWDNFNEKGVYAETMFPFGFGDGGGGPTEDMLEFASRATNYPGVPACRQGLEEQYFDDARAAAPDLPAWQGELYLETHRGTYTTQSATKRANRKNELLLRDAEIAASLASLLGTPVDTSSLRGAWENLLLLQFHDILPGSSIAEVYAEALVDHAHIAATARAVLDHALAALSAQANPVEQTVPAVFVFNSLSWPRIDVATATIADSSETIELVHADGASVPAQIIARHDGQAEIAFAPLSIPPLGCETLTVRPASEPAASSLRASERRIENHFFLIELNENGEITRLLDKRCDREVIPPNQPANRLQLFQDGPEPEAAWNVHATFEKCEYSWDAGTTVRVIESGPVRAMVRITRQYRDSRIEQDIVVYDHSPRIDFVTRADWQARQVMLKVAFPVEVRSPRAAFEIQFGAVERATHTNTSWEQEKFEVCAHRWADLSEPGYGVSLLNDGKYGWDVRGNTLRLTLLRGAEWPDPNADRGQHKFTYSLLPHAGDWREANTVRHAYELNVPLTTRTLASTTVAQERRGDSFLSVDGPAIVEALKPAEDADGLILRVYEPHGSRGPVKINLPDAIQSAFTTNLVEENAAPAPIEDHLLAFSIRPFEIKTFRLRTH